MNDTSQTTGTCPVPASGSPGHRMAQSETAHRGGPRPSLLPRGTQNHLGFTNRVRDRKFLHYLQYKGRTQRSASSQPGVGLQIN